MCPAMARSCVTIMLSNPPLVPWISGWSGASNNGDGGGDSGSWSGTSYAMVWCLFLGNDCWCWHKAVTWSAVNGRLGFASRRRAGMGTLRSSPNPTNSHVCCVNPLLELLPQVGDAESKFICLDLCFHCTGSGTVVDGDSSGDVEDDFLTAECSENQWSTLHHSKVATAQAPCQSIETWKHSWSAAHGESDV